MSPTAVNLLPTEVLRQRREEIARARARLDVELQRLTAALEARTPRPRTLAEHGTYPGYRAHLRVWHTPPCEACKAARTDEQRRQRAAARTIPTQRAGGNE